MEPGDRVDAPPESGMLLFYSRTMRPRFGMIEVALEMRRKTSSLMMVLIAQLDDRPAFYIERVLLRTLV